METKFKCFMKRSDQTVSSSFDPFPWILPSTLSRSRFVSCNDPPRGIRTPRNVYELRLPSSHGFSFISSLPIVVLFFFLVGAVASSKGCLVPVWALGASRFSAPRERPTTTNRRLNERHGEGYRMRSGLHPFRTLRRLRPRQGIGRASCNSTCEEVL